MFIFIFIIIIIIIIGKAAPFEPYPSLEDSARFDPVFTSMDFATNKKLQNKVVSLASNPQSGVPGPCICVPQSQGGPVIPAYTPGSGFPFRRLYDSQGCGEPASDVYYKVYYTSA
jgi:hypothetical protein